MGIRLTAVLLAVLVAAVSPTNAAAQDHSPEHAAVDRSHRFLDALRHKDLPAIEGMLTESATLTVPLSFDGGQAPAGRFVGRDQVLGYVGGVFTAMATIEFTDVRISVTDGGRTSFVQANGDFTTADARPYRNVYLFRTEWDGDHLLAIEEYGNPVTYCRTFGGPGC
ncbi:nuclear transport factor 2 family protein [Nocardia sp. BMG51109]|uniref:nuclear transport factor 2 family protein n=1 Tax=Nocardia sp. BMG51109 TaxID=1056816 RepID=UPI0004654E6F|nr:nuclear transport factor 2 family protein [Nocardia sp. BMG51109]